MTSEVTQSLESHSSDHITTATFQLATVLYGFSGTGLTLFTHTFYTVPATCPLVQLWPLSPVQFQISLQHQPLPLHLPELSSVWLLLLGSSLISSLAILSLSSTVCPLLPSLLCMILYISSLLMYGVVAAHWDFKL